MKAKSPIHRGCVPRLSKNIAAKDRLKGPSIVRNSANYNRQSTSSAYSNTCKVQRRYKFRTTRTTTTTRLGISRPEIFTPFINPRLVLPSLTSPIPCSTILFLSTERRLQGRSQSAWTDAPRRVSERREVKREHVTEG
jgi:hypothetical protein